MVDRVGGKVKYIVRTKLKRPGKNHLVVQDAQSFASAAKALISNTRIIHIGDPKTLVSKDRSFFKGAIKIKGMSKMHMMDVDGEKTSLW